MSPRFGHPSVPPHGHLLHLSHIGAARSLRRHVLQRTNGAQEKDTQ